MALLLNLALSADAPTTATVCLLMLSSTSQVRLFHLLIAYQICRRIFQHNFACFQNIPPMRDMECHVRVLFHEQNRGALTIDLADDIEDFGHDHRREAERWLI